MTNLSKKSFAEPDELKTPPKTNAAVVKLGNVTASKLTLEPGWKWSECVQPAVGGDSCAPCARGATLEHHRRVRALECAVATCRAVSASELSGLRGKSASGAAFARGCATSLSETSRGACNAAVAAASAGGHQRGPLWTWLRR